MFRHQLNNAIQAEIHYIYRSNKIRSMVDATILIHTIDAPLSSIESTLIDFWPSVVQISYTAIIPKSSELQLNQILLGKLRASVLPLCTLGFHFLL